MTFLRSASAAQPRDNRPHGRRCSIGEYAITMPKLCGNSRVGVANRNPTQSCSRRGRRAAIVWLRKTGNQQHLVAPSYAPSAYMRPARIPTQFCCASGTPIAPLPRAHHALKWLTRPFVAANRINWQSADRPSFAATRADRPEMHRCARPMARHQSGGGRMGSGPANPATRAAGGCCATRCCARQFSASASARLAARQK